MLSVPSKWNLAEQSEVTYFRIESKHYTVLDYHVKKINGISILIFWTPTILDTYSQQSFDHDWEPTCSTYNIKENQSLAAFQAWYNAQDEQAQIDYWKMKYSTLAETENTR